MNNSIHALKILYTGEVPHNSVLLYCALRKITLSYYLQALTSLNLIYIVSKKGLITSS